MTHETTDFRLAEPSTPAVSRDGQRIPAVLFAPPEPRGLLLACHGGSGHKLSPAVRAMARAALPLGLGVLAIDGPVHGERRADGDLQPATARLAFREAWRAGVGRTSMAEDMRAALDTVMQEAPWSGVPVGYIGVSMGTAYGVPLLAAEPRIRAAVIGLWGTTYAASEHLAALARDVRCPTWFTMQWNDEFFDREGTLDLFDAIGSPDKRLVAYPGPHKELEGDRLDDAIKFLACRLTS